MRGCQRPREARQRLARSDAARPEAASHEEGRHADARRDGEAGRADALRTPAVGQAHDENPRVSRPLENAFSARGYENRLGHYSDNLLNEKRRSCQQPTGVPPSDRAVCLGSDESECRSERASEPGGDLDRGPVVLDAAERRHDRSLGYLSRARQHADVAGRALEDEVELLVRVAGLEEAG
jgi:hypothetical protein